MSSVWFFFVLFFQKSMLQCIDVSVYWEKELTLCFSQRKDEKASKLYKFIAFVSFNRRCSRPLKPPLFNLPCCRGGYLLCCSENTCSRVLPARGWRFYFIFPYIFCFVFLERVVPEKVPPKDVHHSDMSHLSFTGTQYTNFIIRWSALKILLKLDWGGHSRV